MTCCALVAASEFNARAFAALDAKGHFDCIYAVDGGFAHLLSIGRAPDVALGDFDSLGYVPDLENVEVHPTRKDEADLELAFARAVAHGFDSVCVFGALGGRLDHTISNLQIAVRFAESGIGVIFYGLDSIVRVIVGPDACELPALESGCVSVFAVTDEAVGVTETGMEYGLDGATLSNRVPIGLSNELIGQPARISVERGTLLVFHPLF